MQESLAGQSRSKKRQVAALSVHGSCCSLPLSSLQLTNITALLSGPARYHRSVLDKRPAIAGPSTRGGPSQRPSVDVRGVQCCVPASDYTKLRANRTATTRRHGSSNFIVVPHGPPQTTQAGLP
jgi:hypothetical protein